MTDRLLAAAEKSLRNRRVREALLLFDEAERAKSDLDLCAAGRWECHMLTGHFERAWLESEQIGRRGKPDPNRFWDGQPLNGRRVLIRCLHGLGDTIQFVRYARLVSTVARSVTIEAQPKLKRLIAQSHLADDVITWSERGPCWDQQVEVMELPFIFRTTIETIPREVPYFCAGGTDIQALPSTPKCPRVGVAWASSAFNPARSIPIRELGRLFAIPGVSFYGLQAGPEHLELLRWSSRVHDLHQSVSTLHDTAQVVEQLDLIISVDTMTAHLAGALGMPVWTMLPYECDWRWMLDRDDSPWYPTMRLFRQPSRGNWAAVVDHLAAELTSWISGCSCGAAGYESRAVSRAWSSSAAGTVK